ncbi:hypothetical protein NHQ30_006271 [Ciborinia camelliae]|nr:hypothetical protein NHQ30_006271 [Ciborinia camelliae]
MDVPQKESAAVLMTPENNDEALIPAIMNGASAVQGQSRLPYDFNYYGDFYFTSMKDRERELEDRRKITSCNADGSSKDVFDVGTAFTETSSPFRFFDLPIEIRNLIFEFVLSSVLWFDTELGTYINHVRVGHLRWKELKEPEPKEPFEKLDYFLRRKLRIEAWEANEERRPPLVFSSEEIARKASQYIDYTKDFVFIDEGHPDRSDGVMEVMNSQDLQKECPDHKYYKNPSWTSLEWLRKISYVSAQFRLELGSVIWRRSSIHCLEKNETALELFLDARQGTWHGIKELSILIGYKDISRLEDATGKRREAEEAEFIDVMVLISQRLTLEGFTLHLGGQIDQLMALASGEGPLKVLTSITKLNVTEWFDLIMDGGIGLNDDLENKDEESLAILKFRKKWESKIRKRLLPRTLRSTSQRGQEKPSSKARASKTSSKLDAEYEFWCVDYSCLYGRLYDGPEFDGPEDDGPEDDGPEDDGPEDDGPEDDGPEDDGPEDDGLD